MSEALLENVVVVKKCEREREREADRVTNISRGASSKGRDENERSENPRCEWYKLFEGTEVRCGAYIVGRNLLEENR